MFFQAFQDEYIYFLRPRVGMYEGVINFECSFVHFFLYITLFMHTYVCIYMHHTYQCSVLESWQCHWH